MRCIPKFAEPEILDFLRERKAEGDAKADALLSRLPKKGKRKELDLPGKTAKEKRAEHKASTGDLRSKVMERAAGKCEVCGHEGMVLELEHVLSGGLRRSQQAPDTCLALCADCHRGRHRNSLDVLRVMALHPRLSMRARDAVQHRIDLVALARLAVRSDKP